MHIISEIKAKYQAELAELEAEFAAMEAKVNASLAQEERLFKEDASGRLDGSFILIDVAGADWDDNGTGITSSSTRGNNPHHGQSKRPGRLRRAFWLSKSVSEHAMMNPSRKGHHSVTLPSPEYFRLILRRKPLWLFWQWLLQEGKQSNRLSILSAMLNSFSRSCSAY